MESTALEEVPLSSDSFYRLANHPLKLRLYLLKNLPAAYFSGLAVKEINAKRAVVSVRYKWFTKNPFRSTYFACLSMAAEMSTGLLAMACLYKRKPRVSMLIIAIEGKFYKKAVGVTSFICEEGVSIQNVINEATSSREAKMIRVLSSGYNEHKELVAEFWCEWSFKLK